MTGRTNQQLQLFGVTLTDEQVEELLGCVSEHDRFLDAIGVLRIAGWPGIERTIPGFLARLPRDVPRFQTLLDITREYFGRPPYPVAEVLIDTAIEEGRVGFLDNDLAKYLIEVGADSTKLRILLNATVRAAARDFENIDVRLPEFGDVFPELGLWLKYIAPLAFPDVRGRLHWFLDVVCEHITHVRADQQFVLRDPVQDWIEDAGSHQNEIDRVLVGSVARWMPVLGWDDMELAVVDARARLGLPDLDEEGEEQADSEEGEEHADSSSAT